MPVRYNIKIISDLVNVLLAEGKRFHFLCIPNQCLFAFVFFCNNHSDSCNMISNSGFGFSFLWQLVYLEYLFIADF